MSFKSKKSISSNALVEIAGLTRDGISELIKTSPIYSNIRDRMDAAPFVVLMAVDDGMERGCYANIEYFINRFLKLDVKKEDLKTLSEVYSFTLCTWSPSIVRNLRKSSKVAGLDAVDVLEGWLKQNVDSPVVRLSETDGNSWDEHIFVLMAHLKAQENIIKILGYPKNRVYETVQGLAERICDDLDKKEEVLSSLDGLLRENFLAH